MNCAYHKDCKIWHGHIPRDVYIALHPNPGHIGAVVGIMRRHLCQRMAARGLGHPDDCHALALKAAVATAGARPRSLPGYFAAALSSAVAAFMDEQQQKRTQQRETPGGEVAADTLMEEWL